MYTFHGDHYNLFFTKKNYYRATVKALGIIRCSNVYRNRRNDRATLRHTFNELQNYNNRAMPLPARIYLSSEAFRTVGRTVPLQ